MNQTDIDLELSQGIISNETYRALLDAEIYGTATPMQWLVARLSIIKSAIKSGIVVSYKIGADCGVLENEQKYLEWCEKHFPSAFVLEKSLQW